MPKILVLFHSRTGHTAALADAIAEGARSVRFAETDVRRLEDLAPETLAEAMPAWKEGRVRMAAKYRVLESAEQVAAYDGVIIGSPGDSGAMSAELRQLLDQLAPLAAKGALTDRVGAVFTAAPASRGGHDSALSGMTAALASLGMLICPPGVAADASPLGAVGLTEGDEQIGDADLATARALGKRVAKVAEWVRHAKSHEAPHHHAHGHHHH